MQDNIVTVRGVEYKRKFDWDTFVNVAVAWAIGGIIATLCNVFVGAFIAIPFVIVAQMFVPTTGDVITNGFIVLLFVIEFLFGVRWTFDQFYHPVMERRSDDDL